MSVLALHQPRRAADRHPALGYQARLASSAADVLAAQALRFAVFNLELDEGLAESYDTGLDQDPFDAHCDHLIIEDNQATVVGTYRLQTGQAAAQGLGYYCAREFELGAFEPDRDCILELGRACISVPHRNFAVLTLLWRGIAAYARERGSRYLIGCSSLTSRDSRQGAAAYRKLAPNLAPVRWRALPKLRFSCPLDDCGSTTVKIPRLLGAYLALGAAICAPPAMDREFGTIDFLTWLDIESPRMQEWQRRGRFTA
ncbi:MAG: GNAT family N-acetyltransferase [Rhodoferax sp.]|nr:GNAT family N-acetyltransferase [Rhodoferax sp.]